MHFDYVIAPALLLVLALLVVGFGAVVLGKLRSRPMGIRVFVMRFGTVLLACLCVTVAASSLYNAVRIHSFWAKHPPPGKILTVDKLRMHIDCTGSGTPTVILDAGLGNEAIHWHGVQSRLDRTTRVCSYDRAGFGWSQASTAPADADHLAMTLHDLLAHAGVHGPLVLAGHSLAGLTIRDYASRYPGEVEGMVLIDATSPLQEQDPAFKRTSTHGPPPWLLHAAMIAGVPRLLHMCSPRADHPTVVQQMQSEAYCRIHYPSIAREADNLTISGQETVHTGPYNIPILILSHDPASNLPPHPRPNDQLHEQAWSRLQENQMRLSAHSRIMILQGTTHSLISQRPDAIAQMIAGFIDKIRRSEAQLTSR